MRSSIRQRLLASFLAVALAAAAGLSLYFLKELEAFGLRKLEERLEAEARVAAALLGSVYEETGGPGKAGAVEAKVLDRALESVSPQINSRLRVIDTNGKAIADSQGIGDPYEDYRGRSEIRTALHGRYGATTRVLSGSQRVALYVAVPVTADGRVVGVSYVSASTFSILTLLRDYRLRLALVVGLFGLATLVVTEVLTRWLSRPLRELARAADAFASGDHSVRVPARGASETREVAEAFNLMAAEVGRSVSELREEERRKSRFVSDVSHELRTPLTAIRGAAETLLEGDVPAEDAERFLGTIVSESDRLARLANDLIVLQRIEGATGELPLRRLSLRDVAEHAAETLAPLLEERDVTVRIIGGAPTVLGDADRLQQVTQNLLDNASRYTPRGGEVRVELGGEGGMSILSVVDQGPGIAADDVSHVFDRFYRSAPSRDRGSGGFGLGLSIVKAIVQAHAGTLDAANEPVTGARFTVRLPAIDG